MIASLEMRYIKSPTSQQPAVLHVKRFSPAGSDGVKLQTTRAGRLIDQGRMSLPGRDIILKLLQNAAGSLVQPTASPPAAVQLCNREARRSGTPR